MFVVDAKNKVISTMTKSGCCWHQYSDYIVENNHPKLISTHTEDCQRAPLCTITTEEWKGRKIISIHKCMVLDVKSPKE